MAASRPEINLQYVPSEAIGYGRLGVKLAAELERRGVEVFDHMPPPEGVPFDKVAATGRNAGTANTVCWLSVPTHAIGWWKSQHAAMFTMWEATRLPESFRETFHHFDTLIVPSQQNVDLFSDYHPNVRLALLGVDPAEWHYTPRTQPGGEFRFLIGGSGPRKGCDVAYRAFLAAFPNPPKDGPEPHLYMKSPRGSVFDRDLTFSHDRVTVIDGKLSPEDERDLYASSHCYVQPSRGEGFGLQPLQALAQGMPTILTDAHGHESFAHLGFGLSTELVKAEYFIYGDPGQWWEPDFDECVDLMRWVYDNYGDACDKAKVAAQVIAQDFTWSNTCDQFLDALPDLTVPFTPGGWFKPEPLKFRVRTNKDMRINVAGMPYVLKAGDDQWVLADVKRILFEGGHLDHECVGAEEGLTDEQVARIQPSTDHLYCPSCDQRYGSGRTKADDIFDELTRAAEGDRELTAWHAGAA